MPEDSQIDSDLHVAADDPQNLGSGRDPYLDDSLSVERLAKSLLNLLSEQTSTERHLRLREVESSSEESAGDEYSPDVLCVSHANPDRARYRIHAEIARGGMGAILKGTDLDLGREVAMKVLLESHQGRPELVQRFLEEAQIGGQLQHPGIVPVYEVGRLPDLRPYFTMKLVKGQTLAKLLSLRSHVTADLARMLSLFEQVCQTLAYAHARGVVHRDLKPANIMVGKFGEVQVMDWGLAKVLYAPGNSNANQTPDSTLSIIRTFRGRNSETSGDSATTLAGSVLGTPAYMSPEQAMSELDCVDTRSDVFGLGAILCEILTGKPPYTSSDGEGILRKARQADLEDAHRRLDLCSPDAELSIIARRCLAPFPGDRPTDAGILAHQIQQHRESVGIRLRESELERARMETIAAQESRLQCEQRRRQRITMAFVCMLIMSTALALGALLHAWYTDPRRIDALSRNNTAALATGKRQETIRRHPDSVSQFSVLLRIGAI